MQRRARLLQRDLGAWLARNPDRQPAVVALADVVALLESELVDVEVERLVLVEDVDRGDVESGNHLVGSPVVPMGTSFTLGRDRHTRFSKTAGLHGFPNRHARPHRRELNAVRRDDWPMAPAVAGGGLAHDLAEGPAEGSQAGEGDIEADIGDAAVGLAQEEHRALDPSPLQVPVRRLAEHLAEAAAEVRRRDAHRHRALAHERSPSCAFATLSFSSQPSCWWSRLPRPWHRQARTP